MTYKNFSGLFLVSLLMAVPVFSQEYTRKTIKSYAVSNSTTVDIFNKYGKVHVITWDKDSVRIEVDLKITASSEAKLAKIKNNVNFEFTGTNYYVVAKTKIGSGSETVFGDIKDVAGSLISSENQVTINYTVMLPKFTTFRLENKFGDVYMDDFDGNLNLNLSYGELKANNLNGNTTINISSGDGTVNSVKEGKIMVSYSDFLIREGGKITFDTRSSKITVNSINNAKITSRRDKYYLPDVNDLSGESYFTDFIIGRLSDELNYNFKYGNLSVEQIQKSFSFINISSEYTDLELIFERGSSYELDITHFKDAILNYPRQLGDLETKVLNEEEKQYITYGNIGQPAKPKVKISAPKKCNINIIHR